MVCESLIVQLHTWLLGKTHSQGTARCYASWWQQLKAECFPIWLQKKFPPTYTDHSISTSYVCPHANVKWPDTRHIEFLMTESDSREGGG